MRVPRAREIPSGTPHVGGTRRSGRTVLAGAAVDLREAPRNHTARGTFMAR